MVYLYPGKIGTAKAGKIFGKQKLSSTMTICEPQFWMQIILIIFFKEADYFPRSSKGL